MADNNEEMQKWAEAAAAASGITTEAALDLAKGMRKAGYSFEKIKEVIDRTIKTQKDYEKQNKETARSTMNAIKNLKAENDAGGLTSKKLFSKLESLRDEVEKTTDSRRKDALQQRLSVLEEIALKKRFGEAVKETTKQMSGAVISGFIKSFSGATKAALSGGTAIDIAAGFMESTVDTANNAVQAGANGFKAFGAATAGAKGKIGALGLAASVVGSALGFMGNAISELAKGGITFMLNQTKSMITSFQQMSAIGAIYANGMTEMIGTGLKAGLTLEQFSKVISDNREQLSKLGIGIAEGAKKIAMVMDVNSPSGRKFRDGLFSLGMSAEEQANAVVDTMALMAGPSGKLISSNAAVQAQTTEYAKNLKLISDITGQDAKARMDKLRQDNDTLAFNSVLNKMSEVEKAKTIQAMNAMSAEDQRAFREKQIYGAVISADLNVARATNTAIAKTQDEQFEASRRHALDVNKVADIYERNSANMLDQSNKLGNSLGLASNGIAAEGGKAVNAQTQWAIKWSDSTKRAALIAETEAKGRKGIEPGSAAALMERNQDFALQMQSIANDALPHFGKAIDMTIKAIEKSVAELVKTTVTDTTGFMGFVAKHLETITNASMVAVGAGLSMTGVGAGAGIPLIVAGGIGLAGQSVTGFATGGITTGSASGHMEKLHGTELIVPMIGNMLDLKSKGYSDLLKIVGEPNALVSANMASPTKAATANVATVLIPPEIPKEAAKATSTTIEEKDKHTQQMLNELKKMNDHFTKQEKINNKSFDLLSKIYDVNDKSHSTQQQILANS